MDVESEFRIGDWVVQPGRHRLVGRGGSVALSREETRLLALLAARPGEVVARDRAVQEVWGDLRPPAFGKLTQAIRQLRKAFGDDARNPSVIETVPRRGYRLIAPVSAPEDGAAAGSRYQLLDRIGDGGMGVVYKAEDTRLRRTVALKFLPESWSRDPVAKERFLLEAQAAAALDHPNICTLHEVTETEEGRMFFVMAYYEGETLKRRLARGALPWRQAVEIARQVAAGLASAHSRGIVHRDIKPANIMLTGRGEVKILDFGVARSHGSVRLTRTGTAIGTPTHMSPEQVHGREVDPRSDLWSLGVVLYEMLTGRLPFAADQDHAVLYSIVYSEPEPVTLLAADVPLEVERLVEKALRKDLERRYPDAETLLADLEALESGTLRGSRSFHFETREPSASIAVLPFADLSPQRDQEYFCDGVAEELIHALARLEELRVVSRTSSFQFKGGGEDVRAIGHRLRVGSVLSGSVRAAGRRLRITVELVDVADGTSLWAQRFDRELEDVFAVQDEIARTVVDTLRLKLVGGSETPLVKPHTQDLKAYNLYLEGRYHWNKRTEEDLQRSVACFRRALDLDPGYGRAYAGLADAYATLGVYGAMLPERVMPAAKAAATRALALDDSLAEAHASLGCVQSVHDWSWEEAERSFRRALGLDPNYATAHHWYAMNVLLPQGRVAQAVRQLERARKLDPLSLVISASLGVAAYFARRYADAAEAFSHTLDLDTGFGFAYFFLGQTLVESGRLASAIDVLEEARRLSGGSAETAAALGYAHARAGATREARNVLAELTAEAGRRYVSPSLVAQIHAGLGETGAALDRLEEALEVRAADLAWLKVRPIFDPLREQPRFQALLARMGLAQTASDETVRDLPQLP